MILAVMNETYAIAYIEAWKSQDFSGVWTRNLAIPVQRSNELSNEATDVGSPLFVGYNKAREEWISLYMKCFIYRTADMKSGKLWSSQLWMQFMQLGI